VRAYQFIWTLAAVKILLALLLCTAFLPTCPTGCYCGNYSPSFVYPMIVFCVGVIWIRRGKQYYDLSLQETTTPPVVMETAMVEGPTVEQTTEEETDEGGSNEIV